MGTLEGFPSPPATSSGRQSRPGLTRLALFVTGPWNKLKGYPRFLTTDPRR